MENLSTITIISFGHKHGTPPQANLLYDVRFIKNPYYVERLRPLTGLDQEVQDFFSNEGAAKRFLELLEQQLRDSLPGFIMHGHDHESLTIAFGCTGGKHRSVYFANRCSQIVEKLLRETSQQSRVVQQHRDIDRE